MTDEYCIHEMAPGTCSLCKPAKPKWKAPKQIKPTTAPKSADDPIAPLSGTKDLSWPVFAVEPYLGTDWLASQGYPHDLRPKGWVYLRHDNRLAARVRVVGMRWREDRPTRTGEEGGTFGPGLVFAVDPDSWEQFDQDLGDEGERMRQGYRYHWTDSNDVVHHLMKDDKVPDEDGATDGA